MAESEEELKSLLMKVKEESEKADLKLNIQKTKIMASCPITSWQIVGKQWKQWQTLFSWAPKSLCMVTTAVKLKDTCSLGEKLWQIYTEYLNAETSLCWQSLLVQGMFSFRLLIAFLPRSKHLLISRLQSPSTSDYGAPENKVCHCFHCFPIYLPWSDGTMIFVFWMLSFKPTFSLSFFTFIKRLFSSSSLSVIRVMSSAFLMMYSA